MSDLLPLDRLRPYLRAHLPGLGDITGAEKTATGQSNPTFILHGDAGKLVLRRKPPGPLLKSAHAIEREYRVMAALADTDVPVPRMHLLCEDATVIGSVFFVMDHVEGVTQNDPRCPGLSNALRGALYDAMNATLVALHSVDVAQVGLQDFGRAEGYFARQLGRWTAQYRQSETAKRPDMDRLINWLGAHLPPEDGQSALVHGDWRLDNLLFDPATGAIKAVLDWELSTRGHPLADLAVQVMQWQMQTGPEGRGLAGVDREALGLPSDADYVALYAQRMGWDEIPDMRFPLAFAFFRMAAILDGVKRRAMEGNASNPESGARMGAQIPVLIEKAHAAIGA